MVSASMDGEEDEGGAWVWWRRKMMDVVGCGELWWRT